MLIRSATIVILIFIFGGPSLFAIDCTKAQKNLEKAVCADPELLKLDQELNKEYSQLSARISEQGRKELVDSQREWLAFINDSLCFKDFYPNCKHSKDIYNKSGIAEAYIVRIKFLKVFDQLDKFKLSSFAKIWTNTAGSLDNQTFYIPFMNQCSTHESGLNECFKENWYMKSNQEDFQNILILAREEKHILEHDSLHLCFASEMGLLNADKKNKKDLIFTVNCIENGTLARQTQYLRDVGNLDENEKLKRMQVHSRQIMKEMRAEIRDSESEIEFFDRYKI